MDPICRGFYGIGYRQFEDDTFKAVRGSAGALATIELPHLMAHRRRRFLAEKFFAAVAKDATALLHLVTPDTPGIQYHIEIFQAIESKAYITIYDGTTYGTRQVETATVVGTITAAGNASVVVTAAGMTGSPKTILVPVEEGDDAAAIAGKIRAALAADAAITALFAVSGDTDKIILTRLIRAANDATLNIAIADGTCTGITEAANSANTTGGVAAADGTEVPVVPVNRIPPLATTGVKVYHTPTPVSYGTKMRDNGLLPAGSGPNSIGGTHQSRTEAILGPSQDLLVALTNKDGAGAKDLGIGFDLYVIE